MDFDHYLVKESDALSALIAAIEGHAQDTEAPSQEQSERQETQILHGKLFAFLSAKGGTGTSSLCANLATLLTMANSNHRVAVVDMVLPIGSIAHIVGNSLF